MFNIVFPKNEVEYTYYFQNNNNEYLFIYYQWRNIL